jgi:hypothetical protein
LPLSWRFRLTWAREHRKLSYLWTPYSTLVRDVLRGLFRQKIGYEPDFEAPRTFSEKVQWRKINDRRPLLPLVVDKYRVRDYVRERAGDEILIPLLHVSSDPAAIPFDSLELPYIVKPNNGSGTKFVVRSRAELDVEGAVRRLRDVMREAHAWSWFEWAYSAVPPRIVIERLLLDRDGRLPRDYKFHVFEGRVAYLHVDQNREFQLQTVTYDRNWQPVALKQVGIPVGDPAPPPVNGERMIKLAERLAADLEYARVDLYNVSGQVFFGEITIYPDSGFRPFDPELWDRRWGDLWKLPDLSGGSRKATFA